MATNEKIPQQKPPSKIRTFIRKHGFSVLMGIAFVILLVNPDAKSFVLRQLMLTGLFNASIDKDATDTSSETNVDFSFENEEGTVRNTASLRGKVVFINFWASWCPPCRAEFPSIEALYSQFKDTPDVFFLMVNEDSDVATAKAYLDKEEYAVPLYRTVGNVPSEIYSGALPTTVILDKKGKIRFHHTGFANYASEKFVKQIKEL